MSIPLSLTNIHVLITGASGGIGLSLTEHFLSIGALVTAHFNSSPRELTALADSRPEQLTSISANITSEAEVKTLFAAAERNHGVPVQILIVNHGIWPGESVALADMTLGQWRNTHAVNLDGPFLLCREFMRRLRGQASPVLDPVSICFIGSTAGKFGEADHADYASTKSALMYGLMNTLKNEIVRIAPRGRVNCVSPGWVRTPMAESALSDQKVVDRALSSTPLKKVAMPEDVARQVLMISSPSISGHVTGVNIMVDGGMEGRLLWPPRE